MPLLLLVLACGGKEPLDSGTPPTEEEIGPCGRYSSAWRPNAEWSWQLTPEGEAASDRTGGWEVLAMGEETYQGADVYAVRTTADFDSASWTRDDEQDTLRITCKEDGQHLVAWEGTWVKENSTTGLSDAGWFNIDLTDQPQVLPAELAVGDTWGFDTTMLYSYAGGSNVNMDLSARYEVLGQQTVEVPAGSFEAFAVEVWWSKHPRYRLGEHTEVRYIAADVGEVAIEGLAELLTWDPDPQFQ